MFRKFWITFIAPCGRKCPPDSLKLKKAWLPPTVRWGCFEIIESCLSHHGRKPFSSLSDNCIPLPLRSCVFYALSDWKCSCRSVVDLLSTNSFSLWRDGRGGGCCYPSPIKSRNSQETVSSLFPSCDELLFVRDLFHNIGNGFKFWNKNTTSCRDGTISLPPPAVW